MAPQRKGTGRKKIEIVPIDGEEKRQVSFSKRRSGLFNKVTELSTLCGVEVAAIAFSPGGKAFSVGHPSVESVLDRFHPSNSPVAHAVAAVGGSAGDRNPAPEELIREQGDLRAKLDTDKARKDAMKEASAMARAEGCQAAAWVHTKVSQIGDGDLAPFVAALAKMQAATAAHANKVLLEALLAGHTVHGGGGMEMTQQLLEMGLMMPMPPPTGFTARMETVPYQEFGPYGFPQRGQDGE